jgi:hypothetical protein
MDDPAGRPGPSRKRKSLAELMDAPPAPWMVAAPWATAPQPLPPAPPAVAALMLGGAAGRQKGRGGGGGLLALSQSSNQLAAAADAPGAPLL